MSVRFTHSAMRSHRGFTLSLILLMALSWIITVNVRYKLFGSDVWGEIAVVKNALSSSRWDVLASLYHDYYLYGGFILMMSNLETISLIELSTLFKTVQVVTFTVITIATILLVKRAFKYSDNSMLVAAILPLLFSPLPILCVTKTCISIISSIVSIVLLVTYYALNRDKKALTILFLTLLVIPLIHITSALLLISIFIVSLFIVIIIGKVLRCGDIEVKHCSKLLLISLFILIVGLLLIHVYVTQGFKHYVSIMKYTALTLLSEREALRNPVFLHLTHPTQPIRFCLLMVLYIFYGICILLCLYKVLLDRGFKGKHLRENFLRTYVLILSMSVAALLVFLPFLLIKRLGASIYPDRVLMFHFVLGGYLLFTSGLAYFREKRVIEYMVPLIAAITMVTVFLWPPNLLTSTVSATLKDIRFFDNSNEHVFITAKFVYTHLGKDLLSEESTYACSRLEVYVDKYTFLPLRSLFLSTNYSLCIMINRHANLVVVSTISNILKHYVFEGQLLDIDSALAKCSASHNIVYNTMYSFVAVKKKK